MSSKFIYDISIIIFLRLLHMHHVEYKYFEMSEGTFISIDFSLDEMQYIAAHTLHFNTQMPIQKHIGEIDW